MEKVNCVIIEDEKPAQEILRTFVGKTDWLSLEGVFNDAVEALEYLRNNDVSLLFLDIQLPSLTGLQFLRTLSNPPAVIITTAYSEYALDAFELHVLDYLKKPFSFDRFLKAVNRYPAAGESKAENKTLPAGGSQSFGFFNVNKTMKKVMFDDLLYVESMREYIYLHTTRGRVITKMSTHEIESILGERFLRIHRSFIVNIDKVTAFNAEEIFIDVKNIPIGISYKKQVDEVLRKHAF
ncbi:MAG TPA: LytTR family DNA-binding domain-containing protein [Chryseolinea sp.]|nr:LytTR family DNA-binding domain-containing protein [Chryseolinea sp.]